MGSSKKVVAIGEVGLDYYRNLSPKKVQIASFIKFIRLSSDLKLPLIIHSRDAGPETLDILKKETGGRARGVMHCFSGDERMLEDCIDLGLYISFTCNLTFKNAERLKRVAKAAPIERLLLETDAPFLAPEGMRGRRNEPAYIVKLVEELARIKDLSAGDIGRITTHNASRLFSLGLEEGARIAYPIRDSLYLNITNACTNNCDFCVRRYTDFVKGHNLKLDGEPSAEAVIAAMGEIARYKEVVFCGYGEPTLRLDVIKAVAKKIKAAGVVTRLVTNGHGDLINKRPVALELKGLIDRVSVSLNVDSKDRYARICKPAFGPQAYDAMLKFALTCVVSGIETEMTCLDLPDTDVEKCRAIADGCGAKFRLRKIGVVG